MDKTISSYCLHSPQSLWLYVFGAQGVHGLWRGLGIGAYGALNYKK